MLRPCGYGPCCPQQNDIAFLIGVASIFDSHTSQKELEAGLFHRRVSAIGRAAGYGGCHRCSYARTARQKNLKFWTETHSENHALSLCAPFRPHPRCFPSKTPGRVFSLGTYSSLQAVRMLLKIRFRPQSRHSMTQAVALPCHNSRRPRIRKRKAIPSPYFGLRKHGLKHALFAGSLREQRHAPFEEILDRRVAVTYNDRPSIRETSAELLKSTRSFNASALDFNCRQLRPL